MEGARRGAAQEERHHSDSEPGLAGGKLGNLARKYSYAGGPVGRGPRWSLADRIVLQFFSLADLLPTLDEQFAFLTGSYGPTDVPERPLS